MTPSPSPSPLGNDDDNATKNQKMDDSNSASRRNPTSDQTVPTPTVFTQEIRRSDGVLLAARMDTDGNNTHDVVVTKTPMPASACPQCRLAARYRVENMNGPKKQQRRRGKHSRNQCHHQFAPNNGDSSTTIIVMIRHVLTKPPSPRDILMGRGRPLELHNGNELFRRMVLKSRKHYLSRPRDKRGAAAHGILDKILDTGARFLKRVGGKHKKPDPKQGQWEIATRVEAYEKLCHAMRQKPKYYSSEEESSSSEETDEKKAQRRKKQKACPESNNVNNMALTCMENATSIATTTTNAAAGTLKKQSPCANSLSPPRTFLMTNNMPKRKRRALQTRANPATSHSRPSSFENPIILDQPEPAMSSTGIVPGGGGGGGGGDGRLTNTNNETNTTGALENKMPMAASFDGAPAGGVCGGVLPFATGGVVLGTTTNGLIPPNCATTTPILNQHHSTAMMMAVGMVPPPLAAALGRGVLLGTSICSAVPMATGVDLAAGHQQRTGLPGGAAGLAFSPPYYTNMQTLPSPLAPSTTAMMLGRTGGTAVLPGAYGFGFDMPQSAMIYQHPGVHLPPQHLMAESTAERDAIPDEAYKSSSMTTTATTTATINTTTTTNTTTTSSPALFSGNAAAMVRSPPADTYSSSSFLSAPPAPSPPPCHSLLGGAAQEQEPQYRQEQERQEGDFRMGGGVNYDNDDEEDTPIMTLSAFLKAEDAKYYEEEDDIV